jgi:NAD(P)-dependent dehydrogenase (short-subunit alcohol dehydrogenase family)
VRDKIVLITGGTSGIGRAAADLFARNGAVVVIAARGLQRGQRVEAEIRNSGDRIIFVQTDVSQADQVEQLIARTVGTFGRLDCAFNNAAAISKLARTADFTEMDFATGATSNLRSVWLSMKYEIEQM